MDIDDVFKLSDSDIFGNDEASQCHNAEEILQCIETFRKLFEATDYEQAIIYAVTCPNGILRTRTTLAKFKDVSQYCHGQSILLSFCDALMSTVTNESNKPDELLSLDCINAALNEDRSDLVLHWLQQDRLRTSLPMAHVLADRCVCGTGCVCGYQALAQHVYQTKQAYVGVMLCLLRQGKVNCALEMGRIKNLLNEETLLYLLRTSPSVKLVHELLFLRDVDQSEKRSLLPVGVALNLLLDINHHETVVDWLCDALDSGKFRPSAGNGQLQLERIVISDEKNTIQEWHRIAEELLAVGRQDLALEITVTAIVTCCLREALSDIVC